MSRLPSPRVLIVAVASLCIVALIAVNALQGPTSETVLQGDGRQRAVDNTATTTGAIHPVVLTPNNKPQSTVATNPTELHLQLAHPKVFDARKLHGTVIRVERPEDGSPGEVDPAAPAGQNGDAAQPADPNAQPDQVQGQAPTSNAPAPAPTTSFAGLDFFTWGAGHPPDTNGDVGPTYYIQTINSSIGIFNKTTGSQVAGFTFNAFMSQGTFGNLCDTNNFGDPVVLYDSFEDRWFISDFAFALDGSGNVTPQTVYQCFAVSKTGDPVNGGWNYYSILAPGGLDDYPKFGIWPDGIYMSANMFGYASTAGFISPHVWAINKAQMYAGAPTVSVVDFAAPSADFTLIPGNARLQAGTPPAGTPEYFTSTWEFTNALTVYKLHVDWDKISTSTFSGPDTPLNATSWPNAQVPNAPSLGGNSLDVLQIRAMVQAQYMNIGGTESIWVSHTVRRQNTTGFAAPRWYQIDVTGGTVAPNTLQGTTWDPDGANVMYRFMPSLAVDRMGDMAMGYSTSSSTTKPAIDYAGRLASDPANTLSQGEQVLIQGTGTQVGNCGSSACIRWGDYSGMSLDPDGCTFWMTNEYYTTDGLNHQTRIGSFSYPSCTPVGNGTLSGTVTDGSNPIVGATVSLGSRTTTTDGSGHYSFTVPAGTYPTESAAMAGFDPSSASSLVVPDGGPLTQDFTLSAGAQSGCFTDTSQSDFQRGIASNCDLTASAGDVQLSDQTSVNQQNATVSAGVAISITTYGGQTFTPSVSAPLTGVDVNLFCSACTGTTPNLTVSIRATSGGLPTGADLVSGTITGFSDGGVASFKTVTFGSPLALTAGTQYALVVRPTANPSPGTYALTRSSTDVYAGGTRVSGATSGTVWSIPLTSGSSTDAGFRIYMHTGFPTSGSFVSSLKDANPDASHTATWTTLSFSATTPANTGVQFQIAASNSSSGPFTYVGPDTTTATFFTTSGADLSQFDGFRYLRYKAYLSSTDSAVTPTLSSVALCFSNTPITNPTSLAVDPATGTYGGTTNLSATLTSGANPVPGQSVSFTLNGTGVGSATTDGSGIATINDVSLSGIDSGSYPTGVSASFAGGTGLQSSSGSNSLTVDKATATLTFDAGSLSQTFDGNPKSVTVTTSPTSLDTVTITYDDGSGPTTTAPSAQGSYAVAASLDNTNYQATPINDTLVINAPAPQDQTINFAALPDKTFGDADFDVSASATSGLTVTFGASGNCQMADADTVHLTGAGSCTITASQAGDGTYNPAPDVAHSFNIAKASTTTSVTSNSTTSVYSQFITFTATVGSTAGTPTGSVQFKVGGHNLGAPVALSGGSATSPSTWSLAVGSHSVTATYAASTNFASSSGAMSQTVIKANDTVTVTSSTNPAHKGTNVTFTVNLAPVAHATAGPWGKVQLFVNGHRIAATKKLVHSTVSWTFKWKLGTGTFDVTARFLGTPSFNAAVSAVLDQVITN